MLQRSRLAALVLCDHSTQTMHVAPLSTGSPLSLQPRLTCISQEAAYKVMWFIDCLQQLGELVIKQRYHRMQDFVLLSCSQSFFASTLTVRSKTGGKEVLELA